MYGPVSQHPELGIIPVPYYYESYDSYSTSTLHCLGFVRTAPNNSHPGILFYGPTVSTVASYKRAATRSLPVFVRSLIILVVTLFGIPIWNQPGILEFGIVRIT